MSFDPVETTDQGERKDLNHPLRTQFLKLLRQRLQSEGVPAYFGYDVSEEREPRFHIHAPFGSIILANDKEYRKAGHLERPNVNHRWWVPAGAAYPNVFLSQVVKPQSYIELPQKKLEMQILKLIALIEGNGIFKAELVRLFNPEKQFSGYALRLRDTFSKPLHLFTLGFSTLLDGTPYVSYTSSDYKLPRKRFENMAHYLNYLFGPIREDIKPQVRTFVHIKQRKRFQVTSFHFVIRAALNRMGRLAFVLEARDLFDIKGNHRQYVVDFEALKTISHGKNQNEVSIKEYVPSDDRIVDRFVTGTYVYPKHTLRIISSPYFILEEIGRDSDNKAVAVLLDPYSFTMVEGKIIHKRWYVYTRYLIENFEPHQLW